MWRGILVSVSMLTHVEFSHIIASDVNGPIFRAVHDAKIPSIFWNFTQIPSSFVCRVQIVAQQINIFQAIFRFVTRWMARSEDYHHDIGGFDRIFGFF